MRWENDSKQSYEIQASLELDAGTAQQYWKASNTKKIEVAFLFNVTLPKNGLFTGDKGC